MRGVPQKRKKQMGLKKRMNRLLFSTMIPMACLLVILLLIFWQYAGQYNELSENLAISSKFNLSFKDELDLEVYYIAIGAKESSEMEDAIRQVEDAQDIVERLRKNTYHSNGVKSLNSLNAYMDNLKRRMVQLMEIKEYDKRMEFMDSNIRIITGLIMQEMQNYIYNESMYLVEVETNLTQRVKILISGMAVLLFATLGVLMRRSFRLTGGIIRPVTEMLDKVKKVGKGNFDVIPVTAEIEEIEELDQGINKMAHRISGLLENVRQEKEMQHLTELQLIQAQVNPHFLYNTFECIRAMALYYDADEIAEITMALSRIFRYAIKGHNIVTVEEEIANIREYAKIIFYRFGGRIQVGIEVEEEAKKRNMLKLIIQPVVENSIFHGLEQKLDNGLVTVHARVDENDMLEVEVKDDGCGMEQEQVDQLLYQIKRQSLHRSSQKDSIGLANICHRLGLFYGDKADFTIESSPGKGTRVIIKIPRETEERMEECTKCL